MPQLDDITKALEPNQRSTSLRRIPGIRAKERLVLREEQPEPAMDTSKLQQLLKDQKQIAGIIENTLINMKKDGLSRKTPTYIAEKEKLFLQYWTEFESRHEILASNISTDRSYIKNDFYGQVKCYYEEAMKRISTYKEYANEEGEEDDDQSKKDQDEEPAVGASPIDGNINRDTTEEEDDFKLVTPKNNIEQIGRLKRQKLKINSIRRIIGDIHRNKTSPHTKMYYEYKIWNLHEQFNNITELHEEINEFENEFNDPYFQSGDYENLETAVQEVMILLHERQKTDEPSQTHTIEDAGLRLPRQTIPSFEGNYNNWPAFRDIFSKTIHCNKRLCNAEKLQYLKTNIRGEAAKIIKHLEISDSNYQAAWELMNERYNNKRALLFSQLEVLFNQQHQNIETPGGLKHIHDTTRECMYAIHNLGISTDTWGPIIVFYLLKKLDRETRRWYEQSVKEPREIPDLNEFLKFIETRFQSLENFKDQKKAYDSCKLSVTSRSMTKTFHAIEVRCKYCNEAHSIYKCKKFVAIDVNERCRFIKHNKLCPNCLNHKEDIKCLSKQRCNKCKKYHHTLLHMHQATSGQSDELRQPVSSHAASTKSTQESIEETKKASYNIKLQKQVMLATALVKAHTAMGTYELLRVLIDPGSQASFVTEKAVQTLGLPRNKVEIEISGVGNTTASTSRSQVLLNLSPRFPSSYKLAVETLVLPNLTQMLPCTPISPGELWEKHNFILADPTLNTPGPSDVLLGADVYGSILLEGIRKPRDELLIQNTAFGWIVTGKIETQKTTMQKNVISMVSMVKLNEQLTKFWEIEELPTYSSLSEEDKVVQNHFKESHVRNLNGTYTVSMPLKENAHNLGDSRKIAMARLLQIEKRFRKSVTLKKEYSKFMLEYLNLGHMKQVSPKADGITYYLPHQPVIKEESITTKLRVVFDASAKTNNGLSLNDVMYIGPRLQENLFDILLRWRIHKYVFKADIEKMYRMIQIDDEQQNLQRILWRFSEDEPIKEYVLTTVTYGTASAPYLAVRTLQQLAVDEHNRFPQAVNATLKDFYVDDLMSGGDSIQESMTTMLELIGLLKAGGFNLRKWSSNDINLLKTIPEELREKDPIEISNGETIKTLGVYWTPATDTFHFKVNLCDRKQQTKRTMLSDIAKLFDPLGWLAPIMITAKIMMQELWMEGNSWDEKIQTDVSQKWEKFKKELPQIESISIPRWMQHTLLNQEIELHGFCDASEKAYAAAIYSRVIKQDGTIQTTLLTSKTKVAPIKLKKTLPRLELCGAALLAKLLHQVKVIMHFQHVTTYAWTDSTITLAWIKGGPEKWKTFVANKVAEIVELTTPTIWYHVRSEHNPADVASRGINPSRLLGLNLWWHGPTWLMEQKSKWPSLASPELSTREEMKRQVMCGNISEKDAYLEKIFLKYSKLPKLLRVWAYCQRFINACRRKPISKMHITVAEILNALTSIVRIIQENEFTSDIHKLRKNQNLERKSALLSLNPFLDTEGLIRLGGRIGNSNVPYNEKYPIILPSSHHITKLIVQESHERTLHGSNQTTLAFIRRKFWIIRGKNTVKNVLKNCIRCARFKAQNPSQQMGALPTPRVTPSKPFSHTGIDYAGPIKIRASKGRGITSYKGYIAVFVCLATKAIHLEIVSGLTTEDFLAAYKRFSARRGTCTDIYSDNATTFVSANKVLNKENVRSAASYLANKGTTWHFIPPAAPHFGGIWEAGVKAVKYHLKRVIGETTLTYEEMSTLLCQIEACLNSRPLCPLTDDPTDINTLTPGHFLVGEALIVPPVLTGWEKEQHSLSRWQHIQKMSKDFWQAWTKDYLKQLQQRSKWKSKTSNVKIGQVVLIKDEGTPPTNWPLARITEVHPGSDNLVRVVTLKYKGDHTIKRPIAKICPLPVVEHDDNDLTQSCVKRKIAAHSMSTLIRRQPAPDVHTDQRSVKRMKVSKVSISFTDQSAGENETLGNTVSSKPTQKFNAVNRACVNVPALPSHRDLAANGNETKGRSASDKQDKRDTCTDTASNYKAQVYKFRRDHMQRKRNGVRIYPITTGYKNLVPIEKQLQAVKAYEMRYKTQLPNFAKRYYSEEYRRSTYRGGWWTTIHPTILCLLLLLFVKVGHCSYTLTQPKAGLYVEQMGDVQVKRGTFRIELSLSSAEIRNDSSMLKQTMSQIKTLCDETYKISDETHCQGLIHHLEEIHTETQNHIEMLLSETNKRIKRGILGRLLETVFGVNDEVYKNIDELDHNQKLLLQTINHQTNIMLTTIATANETEARTVKKLNTFTDRLNQGLTAIKKMQAQWFAGPDTNKLNIHFLAAYHAAANYLEELLEKYHKITRVYFHYGSLIDFLKPAQISEIRTKAKGNLPSSLDILPFHNAKIELEFSAEEIKVLAYLNIAELSQYNLIKCTAIPQRKSDNQYLVLDLATPILAINYNTQSYFSLTEMELDSCINIKKNMLLCTPRVIRSIENHPSCIIDELYHRHEGSECPIRQFKLTNVLWKHLHMINTWLFVANKPTTAAIQCNGNHEDVLLNGTGIIRISQECTIKTKRNTLKSEYSLKTPVIASFIKPVPINVSLPTISSFTISTDMEPVIKTSDQIYEALEVEGNNLHVEGSWKIIHHHITGASISTITIFIIAGIIAIIRCKWKRKLTLTDPEATPIEDVESMSEFNLPPIASPRQNVQT